MAPVAKRKAAGGPAGDEEGGEDSGSGVPDATAAARSAGTTRKKTKSKTTNLQGPPKVATKVLASSANERSRHRIWKFDIQCRFYGVHPSKEIVGTGTDSARDHHQSSDLKAFEAC